ncbi:MAG TPA: DEAD/DEAH box helicase [Burkholderiales bacterium]|jgi:superfamily II DNA or RNA helicase
MSAIGFSLQDLRRGMSSVYVERGQRYVSAGRVHARDYDLEHNRYRASVEGSRPEPYRIDARVLAGRTGPTVYGTCTCPVGVNCKHVAAVLLDALAHGSRATPPHELQPEAPQRAAEPALPANLELWIEEARRATQPHAAQEGYPPNVWHRLLYLLDARISAGNAAGLGRNTVQVVSARVRKTTPGYADVRPWTPTYTQMQSPPRFALPQDLRIVRALRMEGMELAPGLFTLEGEAAAQVLRAMLATGRCHYASDENPALREGAPRPATAEWAMRPDGSQQLRFRTEPAADAIVPLAPPWYVDLQRHECGPLECGLPPALAHALAKAPTISPGQAAGARAALAQLAAGAAVPLPQVLEEVQERGRPLPCLRLTSLQGYAYGYRALGQFLDLAELRFDYNGVPVSRNGPPAIHSVRDGKLVRVSRDPKQEKLAHNVLREAGLVTLANAAGPFAREHANDYTFLDAGDWFAFVADTLPRLRAAGWRVEIEPDFRFRPAQVGEWYAEVKESGGDWFDLDLGVDIDGKRVPLLPILVEAVRAHPELLTAQRELPTAAGQTALEGRSLIVRMPNGSFAPVPIARVAPLMSVLHELIEGPPLDNAHLPRLDAVRLADLDDAVEMTWRGGDALRALGRKLAQFQSIVPVTPPRGLLATLRPYQTQGLAWLQFLREYGLNGILADDMGLGKTVQALAHILIEKEAGRLERPALVVCPTSLVPNWKAEAARFAPGLRVHVSHGLKRKASFDRIGAHDIVITTYPLLARDKEMLLSQPFHLAILDEAQQIKNAQTQAARVVTQLKAEHRLCLTGTPLENHLGELWSLFHFLMPGFLGDAKTFRQLYRTPIEKQGDELRRASLVRRLRPFILRRVKEQVAAELPAKTEIVVPVELEGAQRDLYETVRTAMDERVRAEIAARGLMQSQIVVLDALLKLRQICCDPRLLKLDAARKVHDSAKLDALLELLDELLQGGHRVLLFSQFTSMLELVEQALTKRAIRYVKLIGDTRDRAKPVKAFQSGEAPLFLISLKAGGTGLNLTAADTVIHYDPWWNPAVENQATDRAHRIGQDKPVFVYKLIVSGSVEEKIAQLQEKKAALVKGVLGEGAATGAALTADDIRVLFEPIS